MAECIGTKVWVRCGRRAWTRGTIENRTEKDGNFVFKVRKEPVDDDSNDSHDGFDEEDEFVNVEGASPEISSQQDMFMCNVFDDGKTLADTEDLTWLTHLHEPSILQALSDRFDRDLIYTNTGPILLAVNPFKSINLYTIEKLEMYYSVGLLRSQGVEAPQLAPHVFATGDSAYRNLMDTSDQNSKNQSILVSGESGAGKTESTKYIMRYLVRVAKDDKDAGGQKIADMVLQSNPILEAFGNARTNRNDNSSRFGKFIEMQFNQVGVLVGARIVTYLLEKVRLTKQGIGERNFHVFYQLCRGASDEQLEAWRVPKLEDCSFTNQSECFDRKDGVDDDTQFENMWKAMETMGFPDEEKSSLMQIVSSIMNIGNLQFLPQGEGCVLSDDSTESLDACAYLFGVDKDALVKALTIRRIKVGAEWFDKPLTPEEAEDARDALVKATYSRMFDHVVVRINQSIQVGARIKTNFIGILDIFGFEVFQSNSFEQLCINYANETLQQHFNQFVFKLEQREYEKEKIKWSFIDFPDNQQCLDLIEAKPIGIISLLDEQCLFPKGNDKSLASKFYEKLTGVDRFSVSNKEKVANQFTIDHYAGRVTYDTVGFVAKNKDQLYQEAMDLMQTADKVLLKTLFPKAKGEQADKSGRTIQSKTLGSQFKEQLATLLKIIRSTAPHYVRCLKPNDVAAANKIVRPRLVEQLRYGGVLEAVKVARAGYPVRLILADFVTRYFMLAEGKKVMKVSKARTDGDGRPACMTIVEATKLEAEQEYQVGRTKLFLRKGAYEKIEELRLKKLKAMATKIQSVFRGRRDFRRYQSMLKACSKIQAFSRGMLGRKKARHVRATRSAIKIQAAVRSALARAYRKRSIRRVIKIQNAFRALKASKALKSLREDKAALRIQSWYRGQPLRRKFLQQQLAIVVVQTRIRGALARIARKRLREEARQVGSLQGKITELQNRIKVLEEELQVEKERNEQLKASSASASVESDSSSERQAQLVAQIVTLEERLAEASKENDRLSQELVESSAAAAAAVTAAASVEATSFPSEDVDQSDLKAQIAELQDQLAAASKKNEQLSEELSSTQAAAALAATAAAVSVSSSAAVSSSAPPSPPKSPPPAPAPPLEDGMNDLSERIAKLEQELEQERNKSATLTAAAVARNASLSAPVQPPPSEESALQEPNNDISESQDAGPILAQVEELKLLVQQLTAENEQLKEETSTEKPAMVVARAESTRSIDLEKENATLIEQQAHLVERMCDAENRVMEVETDLANVKRKNRELSESLDELNKQHSQGNGVKIALAKRLETLILENSTLRDEKNKLEEENDKLQQSNRILQARS